MTQGTFEHLSPRASLRDRVLVLRSVDTLAGLDDEGLALLAEHGVRRTYVAGDVITEEGDPPRMIAVIVEGQVTITRKGRPPVVFRQGDGFGMLTVMAEQPVGRAVADTSVVTLEIPAAAFRVALEENFSLLRNSLRIMSLALGRARGNLPADADNPPKMDLGAYYENPRTLVEQLIELRKGPFVQMNIDALVDLARRMIEVRVPAGHTFWSAGEASRFALHVEYGCVRCTAPDGKHVDIGQDFTIGVMDVWSNQPRSYTAKTETPVIGYRIDYEDFLVICEMHLSVGLDMLRGLARQFLASDKTNAA